MADSKKKGVVATDSTSSAKSSSKVSKVFDALNKICGIAKELKDDALAVEEFTKLLENQKRLEAELKSRETQIRELRKEKDQAVACLRAEIQTLTDAKNVLWNEFHAEYGKHKDQLSTLQKTGNELRQAKALLQDKTEEADRYRAENKKLRAELKKLVEQLKREEELLAANENTHKDLELRHAGTVAKYEELRDLVRIDKLWDHNAEKVSVFLSASPSGLC